MVKVLNSSRALPAANSHPISLASFSYHSRPVSDSGVLSPSSSLSSSQSKPAIIKESDLSTYTSFAQAGPSRTLMDLLSLQILQVHLGLQIVTARSAKLLWLQIL
jgi:hypothetical protein